MTRTTAHVLLAVGTPILVLGIWYVASLGGGSFYFPSLAVVLDAFAENWLLSDRAVTDVLPSIVRVLSGLAIGVVLGVTLGVVLGLLPRVARAVEPIVEFVRAVPAPAMIPMAILLFGFGEEMKIFIIAVVCTFPVLLNTLDGVVGIDPGYRDAAEIYRIPRAGYVARVVLPAATPQIFAGVRVSLAMALIMMVVAEMVGSQNGIGNFVLVSARTFRIDDMWSGILLLGILGYAFTAAFVLLERGVLRWHRGARGHE